MQFRDAEHTCIIFASGPTAGLCDTDLIRGWPCIAVNDGIYLYTEAEALYSADKRWWDAHIGAVREHAPRCELWTQDRAAAKTFGLNYIEGIRAAGLSLEQGKIKLGGTIGNSGAQAMNLAVLWGARRLLLVGFDMKKIDGKSHYFGEHKGPLLAGDNYHIFVKQMGPMAAELHAAGVKVLNTSRDSALTYFDYCPLVRALAASRLSAN